MFKTVSEAAAGDDKLRAKIYRLTKKGTLEHKDDAGTLKINYKQLLELVAQEAKESSSAVYGMTCAVRNEPANMPTVTPAAPAVAASPATPSPEIMALLTAMNQLTAQVGMMQVHLDRLAASTVPETRSGWFHRVLVRAGLLRHK